MKKGLSAVLLFAAVQILLFLIVSSALGMPLTQLLEQRLLSALVLGFGFLIAVLIGLLLRYLELPEVSQAKGTASAAKITFISPYPFPMTAAFRKHLSKMEVI